jgi:DNA primase
LQADIRVTTLPQGLDPDDVVNRDPAEWDSILANAKPIVVHVMETLAANRDITDAKVKTEIASQVLPLIQDLPSPIERDTYIQQLARMLQIDEQALRSEQRRRRPGRRRAPSPPKAVKAEAEESLADAIAAKLVSTTISTHALEAHCLGVLFRQPEFLYHIDRALQQTGLDRMSSQDFQHADHQVMLRLVRDSLEQDHAEPQHYIMDNLPLDLMETADKHLEQTDKIGPNEQRILEDVLRAILQMRGRSLSQSIEHLRFLMEAAQEQGDLKASQYQETMTQYISARSRLDQAQRELSKHNFTSHPIL